MRKNSNRYIEWKKKRDLSIEKKNIKKNNWRKNRRRKAEKQKKVGVKNQEHITLSSPKILSIKENFEETIKFFNKVISLMKDKTKNCFYTVHLDLSEIEKITIDAIMYLEAIGSNVRDKNKKIVSLKCKLPLHSEPRDLLENSGLMERLEHNISVEEFIKSGEFKIISSSEIKGELGKICVDYIFKDLKRTLKKQIYTLLLELMSNTKEHAYSKEETFKKRWYIYCEQLQGNKFLVTFLDIGLGITKTIKKKWSEKTWSMVKLGKTDSHYVKSTLNGDFRTETGEKHRGRGLPYIKEIFEGGIIQNMSIISNKGVNMLENKLGKCTHNIYDYKEEFKGTLFQWEVDLSHENK